MNKLKLIAGVLLIFMTGIAAGHFGTVFYFKNKIFKQGPPAFHHLIENKISRELKLTQQQKIKINKIILQAEKNFDSFRKKHRPELKLNLSGCFKKINEILTPEQQERFKQIQNRFERGFRGSKRFSGPKGLSPQQVFGKQAFIPIDKLTEKLNLSENQSKNIQPIIHQFNQDVQNIFMEKRTHKDDLDRDMHKSHDHRVNINKVKNDMLVQVKPYLNEKQFLGFQEMIKNRRPHHPDEK
jgi:Spy/CpxP family protein refolding chaperone